MATWYISPTGNDTTGNGSSALPWQTISKAHTSASSGDTIICKSSTSTYSLVNQTFTKSLTIQGEATPVYNPLTGGWVGAIFDAGGANLVWTINASVSLTVNGVIFQNIVQAGADGSGFFRPGLGATLTLINFIGRILTIHSSGTGTGRGVIYIAQNNVTVSVRSSIFYSVTPINSSYSLFYMASGTGVVFDFYNNVVYLDNPMVVFGFLGAVTPTYLIKNNIFVAATSATLRSGGSPTITFDNNDTNGSWSTVPSGSNNITSDPLFVAPANGDFRFRTGSPCADAGVAL